MPLRQLNLGMSSRTPSMTGTAVITLNKRYRAVLNGRAFKKGEVVTVTYAGRDKVTFMADKASLSMLPTDFLNAFEEFHD